ncbi:MAG: tetratricopeptide (TPR) repeat protein/TolB-like protein [Rhodothermales bacterium]|jgi:tetratricopeptide (TPR) repeat protein/TolB-like protein
MGTSDSDRWGLLEEWFERLTDLTPEKRGDQLEELDATDPSLANELRRLFDTRATGYFDDLAAGVIDSVGKASPEEPAEEVYAAGDQINQFEILGELGRGGMGVVYRARDTVLTRDVALKFLPARIADNADSRERFIREARVVSHVDHPNICTIYDVAVDESGRSFIVMACYEGQTLRALLDRGPMSQEQALDFFCQAASGLEVAHQHDVVHRDIKPDNIFITTSGQVKILDFGIAKALQDDSLTREGTRLGTLNYMSPEQARGLEADARTDIWSLGIMMYEMLAGRRPFEARYDQALLFAIVNEPTPQFTEDDTAEPWLTAIVSRCLLKDPDARYASCEAILADVRRAEVTAGSVARKWRMALALPVILLIAAAALIGWLALRPGNTQRTAEVPGREITVAISPFRDLTGDGSHAAVGEGLASDLMTRLGGLGGLRLIRARQTEPGEMAAYGESLDADYFLGGEIQGELGNLRVYASLTKVSDGSQRWGGTFDRLVNRELDVQAEISSAIVDTLSLQFSREELATRGRGSQIIPAQEAYLKGIAHVLRRTPFDLAAAAEFFREATRLDRDFAAAWSGFGYARMLQGGTAYSPEKGTDAYEDARAAASIALDLDPNQALAMTTLASIYSEFDWKPAKADSAFELALAMNPNSAEARHLYASHLSESGRLDEAIAQQRRAGLLDPESLIHPTNLGLIQLYRGENEEALKTFDSVVQQDPTFYMAHLNRSTLLMVMGRAEEAISAISTAELVVGSPPVVRAIRASALALSGDEGGARDILKSMEAESETTYVSPPLFAQVYLALSDTSRALDYLEQGLKARDVYMTVIKPWPFGAVLKDNARFKRILAAMEGDGR